MAHRLALERFDRIPPAPQATDPAPGEERSQEPQTVPWPAATSDLSPREDAPPIGDTATPDTGIAKLTHALAGIVQSAGIRRRQAETAAAEALGLAAVQAVPHLARSGFAAEVASAALAILHVGGASRACLYLAPADCADVAALLPSHGAEGGDEGLLLRPDPALEPGTARLDWNGGGAEFDAEALTRAALAALSLHLPAPPATSPDIDAGPDHDTHQQESQIP